MRVRLGFVSNSSSSSFCIYGANIQDYDDSYNFDEILKKFNCEDRYDLQTALEQEGLEAYNGPDSDGFYVGRSWSNIKDDETGAEFKGSIQQKLNEIIGQEVKLSTFEESWYDG